MATVAPATNIKVLKGAERDQIDAHLATVNPGDTTQAVSGKFLSFGSDSQAVKGLSHLLGMDQQYANDVIQKGEEMMKREVDALQFHEGDPKDWFHQPSRNADGSWNWNNLEENKSEVVEVRDERWRKSWKRWKPLRKPWWRSQKSSVDHRKIARWSLRRKNACGEASIKG